MLDIFKKSKSSKKASAPIIIDHREKESLIASELAALGVPFEFKHLPIGDYLVANTLVERKSLYDLQASIINKRIFDQMRQLKAQPTHLLLIIELESEESIYKGIIHENALRGFFLSLAREERIPIIFSQSQKDTAKYLCLLNKKTEKRHFSLRPSRILDSRETTRQFILEGFPGIGPATAKKLIMQFDSIKNIINAPDEELRKVLGKKLEKFKSLLD